MTDDELLAAYLDGVAELDADERHRVDDLLRDHPEARAEAAQTSAMLARLRALPSSEAAEPDWNVLERAIRTAVGPDAPRPWWRRVTWLVPLGALVASTATLLLWLHHPGAELTPAARLDGGVTAPAPAPLATNAASTATAVWLDGHAIEVGDVDPASLLGDQDDHHDSLTATATDADDLGLLPVDDLGWVDALDDKAIDRAEHWLARKKG